MGENVILGFNFPEKWQGERTSKGMRLITLVFALAEVHVTMRFRPMACAPLKEEQTAGIRYRHGAKHDRVNQAEDCRVSADPQRQRDDCNDRKCRRFTQHAPGITRVLKQGFKDADAMDFPQGFTSLLDAPEGDERLAARFFPGHACADILLDFL